MPVFDIKIVEFKDQPKSYGKGKHEGELCRDKEVLYPEDLLKCAYHTPVGGNTTLE